MQAFSLFLSSPPVRDFIRATNRPVADVLTRGRFDGVHSELKFGGAAFFVLDGLRKTGLQNHVLPSFPIGNDEHGDAFLREFESSGIKTDHISRYPGRTRQNFVAEHTDDRRIYQDEFRPQLRHDHFELGMIPQCSQLLISGSLPLDIVREAIAAAKNANIPFCWNPYPVHFDLIDEIAPGAAMIQLNLEEACEVLGATSAAVSTSAEAHRFLRDLYDHTIANTVVVTWHGRPTLWRARNHAQGARLRLSSGAERNGHRIVERRRRMIELREVLTNGFGISNVRRNCTRIALTSIPAPLSRAVNPRRGGPAVTGRGVTVPLADGSGFWPEAPGVSWDAHHKRRGRDLANKLRGRVVTSGRSGAFADSTQPIVGRSTGLQAYHGLC
ncbi:MAG: hypothetical protein FD138_2391 [Planctomycetota bacterium]|nr:MAG: hypothetical protein FD138_2391 [Planctomycetota bacterium]